MKLNIVVELEAGEFESTVSRGLELIQAVRIQQDHKMTEVLNALSQVAVMYLNSKKDAEAPPPRREEGPAYEDDGREEGSSPKTPWSDED